LHWDFICKYSKIWNTSGPKQLRQRILNLCIYFNTCNLFFLITSTKPKAPSSNPSSTKKRKNHTPVLPKKKTTHRWYLFHPGTWPNSFPTTPKVLLEYSQQMAAHSLPWSTRFWQCHI
jgi:hypothetical protein